MNNAFSQMTQICRILPQHQESSLDPSRDPPLQLREQACSVCRGFSTPVKHAKKVLGFSMIYLYAFCRPQSGMFLLWRTRITAASGFLPHPFEICHVRSEPAAPRYAISVEQRLFMSGR